MSRHINWYGRIAILGKPTDDGRHPPLSQMSMGRLHVPVIYRTPDPVTVMHVGHVERMRVFPTLSDGGRPGAVWATLVLDLDRLYAYVGRQNLYPEVDVDPDMTLRAVWLGTRPAWPELKPVIEVDL